MEKLPLMIGVSPKARNTRLVSFLIICLLGATTQHALSPVGSEPIELEENWVATWGEESYQSPRRIMIDDNYIYVVGRTWDSETKDSNVFLLKYDSDGELEWNVTWDSPSLVWPNEFTIHDESIYITGVTVVSENDWDVLVLKFNKQGQFLWNASWGGVGWESEPGRDEGFDIEVLNGDVYVVGTTTSDSGSLNEQDFLILKYDSGGGLLWRENLGGSLTYEYGRCLEVDGDELYVAGHFLEIKGPSERNSEVLLAKLDSDGNLKWNVTGERGFYAMNIRGMTLVDNYIYVSGSAILPGKRWELYLVKFEKNGEFQWSSTWMGDHTQGGMAVHDERLYIIGQTRRLDPKNSDIFLYGYDSDGLVQFNSTWGREANETGWDLSIVGDTMYFMGQTTSEGKTDVYLASIKNPFVVKEEPKWFKDIPGFRYESIIIGLIIGVILIWQLKERPACAQLTGKTLRNLHARR